MHPRILARDNCSGGTCPAVYDLNPTCRTISRSRASRRARNCSAGSTGIAPDETAVIIGRDLVAKALRPADTPVNLAGLMAALETFAYSAFRLEVLQHYAGTGRDEEWEALVKAGRRFAGKTFQRVHVITEPLTAAHAAGADRGLRTERGRRRGHRHHLRRRR